MIQWSYSVQSLARTTAAGLALWQWAALLAAFALSWWISKRLATALSAAFARVAARTDVQWDDELAAAAPGPARLALTFVLARAGLVSARLPDGWREFVDRSTVVALVFSVAWLLVRVLSFATALLEARAKERAEGNDASLRARGLSTQLRVLRRAGSILIGFFALCVALLQFDVVRSVGVSLLASAGVVGVVVGVAAQRSIASLLMGAQLSFTQPIRLGDTIVFEGEWGQIEEVTLTYVVLRVWDKRRIVIPITRLLEQPVQNWTKVSPELLGTVFVQADPAVPVAQMREAFDKIVEAHPLWDRAAKGLVVTDLKERTVELRATVSAANGESLWQLRCEVREALLRWLQEHEGGRYLPKTRVALDAATETARR